MKSTYYEEDKLLILTITEEIDDYCVQSIRRKADYEIERYIPKRVIFDFHRVTFMDSAGIGFIIGRYRLVDMLGGKLELANLNDSVRKIFDMCGIFRLIQETSLEDMKKIC